MRISAIAIALLAWTAAPATAQERAEEAEHAGERERAGEREHDAIPHHRISFESSRVELDVFLGLPGGGLHPVCTTPCGHVVHEGTYRLAYSREPGGRDPVGFDEIEVDRALTLRVEWIDRSDVRLVGDVVLIVGITLGALVGGTAFGNYDGNDAGVLGLGVAGLALVGGSLLVGIPLSLVDDGVQLAE